MNSNAVPCRVLDPGAGDDVDDAGGMETGLGSHGCGLDAELGYGVGEGIGEAGVGLVVVIVATVEAVVGLIALSAGDLRGD